MWQGEVVSIHLVGQKGQPTAPVKQARAVPGKGLEGDRYYQAGGAAPDRGATLIEIESLEALEREGQVQMAPGEARRQIVTRGVPLNHLVGVEFLVGEVRLRGMRLCEPCQHLTDLTHPSVLRGPVHRGGLRAQILTEGVIRPGDPVSASK